MNPNQTSQNSKRKFSLIAQPNSIPYSDENGDFDQTWKEKFSNASKISKVNIYSRAVIDNDIISINSLIYDNTRNYFTPIFSVKDIFNADTWEINVKFKYLGRISNYATIATMGIAPLENSVNYQGFNFGIENGSICLFLSSNGNSWDIVNKSYTDTQISLVANTIYNFKLEFTGSQYDLYAKAETDDGYTLLQTVISSTKIGTSNNDKSAIIYSNNCFTGNNYQLYADWYLRFCNIIINNEIVGTLSNDFVYEKNTPIIINNSATPTLNIVENKNYELANSSITTITFSSSQKSKLPTTIKFTTGNSAPSFTDNSGINWTDGTPTFLANKTYQIIIFDNDGYLKEF